MRISLFLAAAWCAESAVVDFGAQAGVVNTGDNSVATCWANGAALNATLAALRPGDELVFASGLTYHLMGGIQVKGLVNVTVRFDATLVFCDALLEWPRGPGGGVLECLDFQGCDGLTLTSSAVWVAPKRKGDDYEPPVPPADGKGLIDGNGLRWWGIPGIGYLVRTEDRPRLVALNGCTNILVENLYLKDSPYWTFWAPDSMNLEVRFTKVDAKRTQLQMHDLLDMTAFNTDGFDFTGQDIWLHDCEVWNQDDCVAVKDGTKNVLVERVTASGVGLTIGSIGSSAVANVTFRDCFMPDTYKGIYLKFRDEEGGAISDVWISDVRIVRPSQWPIWIGPAQQSDSRNLCSPHPCSICWPMVPRAQCHASSGAQYTNINLSNVTVVDPVFSPGVVLANSTTHPMRGVTFHDVVFENPPADGAWGEAYYHCEGVEGGVATGGTWPVPPCFDDQTDAALAKRNQETAKAAA